MKTIKLLFGTLLIISVVLFACKKKDPDVIVLPPINNPTPTSSISTFFDNNLESEIQTFTINPSTDYMVTGINGTTLFFNANTFEDMNGYTVSGLIEIEMIETQSNKEMLLWNRPTTTTDGQLLISGGIVYVNVSQGGNQLSINDNAPIQVSVPSDNYIAMDYFTGSEDNNGRFGWELDDTDTVTTNTADTTNWNPNGGGLFTFDFTIDSIGWINCDIFYGTGDPLTGVQVELPDSFNGTNSAVFIYYSNLNSVASLYDYDEDGVFDLGGWSYATPIGQNISFIVISEINGSFYYAIVNATILNGHYEIISSMDMMGPVSSTDIQNAINAL